MYASPALKSKFSGHSGFMKNTRHRCHLFVEIEQGFVYSICFRGCNFNLKIRLGKICVDFVAKSNTTPLYV